MANAAPAAKPVDESLWWDSFVALFDELDKVPPSEKLPDHLAEKLRRNHAWFVNSVARFKPPDRTSRLALDSHEIAVGSHRLLVKPELKNAALRFSELVCLNEVQSYILVRRSYRISKLVADVEDKEFLHSVLLNYFVERQCLLQCLRRIFVNALHTSNGLLSTEAFKGIALLLIDDGFERKLLTIFQDLLLSIFSDQTEVDIKILWVDEILIEENLLMDILFLAYYDNFCSCKIEQWKTMCSLFKDVLCGSLNIGKVAVSTEARNSFAHVKAKMVLILIETLDLENLLHMVHDEIPFREGGSVFSVIDIKEMDAQVSSFYDLGAVEAGPLLLAWAVFLSLLLSLHETHNSSTLMEIDHVSYVRQAFEVAAFDYILEILRNDKFRDSDGPVSGFLSVMRTFLSAFIASYELSHQESLALQFWDKECFVDGPIRSILFMLEKEYPIHVTEFVRLLSAVCEGSWPAECVYNYLDKMSGITTLFEISGGYGDKTVSDIIETHHPVAVPVCTFRHFASPFALTQDIHSDNVDDVSFTLNLFHRIISFNKALGFALLGLDKSLPIQTSKNSMQLAMGMSVDMVKIICTLIFKSVQDVSKTQILSVSLDILTEMLKCVPSHLVEKGAGDNLVSAFIIFSLQYVFVNHMHWKYKSKHSCWKVTLKVFEVIKSCIRASKDSQKLSGIIWDILLYDSSIHNILCRIMCISAEALRSYISHRHEFKEIEDLQLAICSAFDVLCSIMPYISQETSSNVSALVQMVLSPSIKPLPVVQAAVSLISFSENSPTLLSSLIFSEEKEEVSSDVTSDSVKQLATVPVAENLGSYSASSPIEAIRNYVESSEILFDGAPHLLLSILNFLKALWEGGIQFSNILGKIRVSKKFWECLSSFLSPTHVMNGLLKKSTGAWVMFYGSWHMNSFSGKIMQCEKPDKVICTSTVNATSRQANVLYAQEILSTWFVDSSFLENLIKSFSDIEYNKEVVFRAKVAVCVCIIHLIAKLTTGNAGSLSMSLVKKIREIYNTAGGSEIPSGPFQELSNFLLSLGTFECNDEKYERIFCLHLENISMFDIKKVQEEIGADLWDLSDWKTSKGVAESMFIHIHSANYALVSVIAVYKGNMNNTKESFLHGRDISESAVESGIQYLCGCLQHVADMLVLEQNMPEGFLRVFIAQQELLLILSVILFKHNSHRTNKIRFLPLSILVTKSTGSIIKVCADVRPITRLLRSAVKLVLTLLLTSLEFSNNMSHEENKSDFEVKLLADASFISIGLLPVLCKYTQDAEYSNLSVATMDLIMKALNPDTWLPILRKHLPLQHILQNIQERDALASAPVIFNFLLTLGRIKRWS
ncbi:mRNA transport [Musa troglodytarum]|uniref:mRNA transport n=1 Tax=Musa troglodytarum TaxID=320322 RepID=A0A9E7KYB3_9LILI|nr:mRNA transport [Musa troglodytarum]